MQYTRLIVLFYQYHQYYTGRILIKSTINCVLLIPTPKAVVPHQLKLQPFFIFIINSILRLIGINSRSFSQQTGLLFVNSLRFTLINHLLHAFNKLCLHFVFSTVIEALEDGGQCCDCILRNLPIVFRVCGFDFGVSVENVKQSIFFDVTQNRIFIGILSKGLQVIAYLQLYLLLLPQRQLQNAQVNALQTYPAHQAVVGNLTGQYSVHIVNLHQAVKQELSQACFPKNRKNELRHCFVFTSNITKDDQCQF